MYLPVVMMMPFVPRTRPGTYSAYGETSAGLSGIRLVPNNNEKHLWHFLLSALNGQKVLNPEMDDNGCATGKETQTIGFTIETLLGSHLDATDLYRLF
jgi:hypothetical protein